jgi:hypothetical protein
MQDGAGLQVTLGSGEKAVIPYVPISPADWLAVPPADFNTAIDRMAKQIVILLGGPIP